MSSDPNRLVAIVRTEFGKGAARRTRRDGQVPAVLYGHASDPQHLALDARAFAKVLRDSGTNAVLTLDIAGKEQVALTKSVVVHPIRRYIEHADLLVIKKGEKVVIDVPVVVTGEAAAGALVTQDANVISVESDATKIPQQLEVSVQDAEIGTQILAGQIELPEGSTLNADPETLIVNVVPAPTEEELEVEGEGEAAEGDEAAVDGDEAEGEAAEGESTEGDEN
ncbi:50S ribosomal protein L25/general stress protein Ctc [Antrihabitans cavernicola]|uniref:Large ribosomal subunit protein bL25 n=1 Tax=Antrihabitans cavernicola TaxID=2495913 RepID=A0A5A7SCG1_9NOCA|nr:50S ribosomal protein L25/general stress protein Ctc [Spelaeibacter cavernicola]KAA0023840.1 50S ribosomal protein L25/general stress protein Ctc [Spelaeibacter cavernicola]